MAREQDILTQASEHIGEFFNSDAIRNWRRYEVRENYAVVDGSADGLGQWRKEDYDAQIRDALPIVTINKTSPVIDAITGFAIQNSAGVEYQPRILSDEQQEERSDRMQAVAKYFEHDSNAEFHDEEAFRDMTICGIGCADFDIDYMHPPHDGNLRQTRLFPGFIGWDVNAREKNLLDANHVWQAKIVRRSVAEKRLKAKGKQPAGTLPSGASSMSTGLAEFIDFFDVNLRSNVELDIIYLYQWREEEPFYKVKNPFLNLPQHPLIMNYAAKAEELYGFKLNDITFNIDADQYKAFKKDMDFFQVKLEQVKLEKWKYYRAEIIGDTLVDYAENMSQKGFSQKFMTGKFSPVDQMYFGAVRAMKSPQRLYNKAMSNTQGFLDNMVMNGVNIEEGAVHDLQGFVDSYPRSRAKGVTVYKNTALANGQVQPKMPSPFPPGLLEMVGLSGQSVMEMPGVTPAFMGLADSADESGALFGQKVRQGMTVLGWLMQARKLFLTEKGRLYIDAARILAENNPGRPIYNFQAEVGEDKHFRLFGDDIADEYDLVSGEMPLTPDEKMEVFKSLMGLAERMPQLSALALDFAPQLTKKQKDMAKQAIMPPPAPPPNPLEVAMIEAETQSKTSNAQLNTAKAEKEKILTLQEIEKLKNGTFEDKPEPVDHSAAIDLADRAVKAELERRKIDMEEAKTAADIAEKDRRIELDTRKLQLEERRVNLDNEKIGVEREKIMAMARAKESKPQGARQ